MSLVPTTNYRHLFYYGNKATKEVHDVPSETAHCQLAEIKDGVRFILDTLEEAHANGYNNCAWCLGESTR